MDIGISMESGTKTSSELQRTLKPRFQTGQSERNLYTRAVIVAAVYLDIQVTSEPIGDVYSRSTIVAWDPSLSLHFCYDSSI